MSSIKSKFLTVRLIIPVEANGIKIIVLPKTAAAMHPGIFTTKPRSKAPKLFEEKIN